MTMSIEHLRLRRVFLSAAMLTASGAAPALAGVIDPASDFVSSYTGPWSPDSDVLATGITFDGSAFAFSGTLPVPSG